MNEAAACREEIFSLEATKVAISKTKAFSSSLRLPRSALKGRLAIHAQLIWALAKLIAALNVQPDCWVREICPIRKAGSGPVRNTKDLRPISCVEDIEAVFDALWLSEVRPQLESFMSFLQSGGRFDHVLVVLGTVLMLQARMAQGRPTLLEVCDLVRGFESVWRDALRWLLRMAGLKGWHWPIADTFLRHENLRVRVGRMLGTLVSLAHMSIGQGKASGPHLFGVFTRALTSFWEGRSAGPAIFFPPGIISFCKGFGRSL